MAKVLQHQVPSDAIQNNSRGDSTEGNNFSKLKKRENLGKKMSRKGAHKTAAAKELEIIFSISTVFSFSFRTSTFLSIFFALYLPTCVHWSIDLYVCLPIFTMKVVLLFEHSYVLFNLTVNLPMFYCCIYLCTWVRHIVCLCIIPMVVCFIHLSTYPCMHLAVYPSIYLSLDTFLLFIHLYIYLCIQFYPYIHSPIYVSIYLFMHLNIYLYTCISIYLPISVYK